MKKSRAKAIPPKLQEAIDRAVDDAAWHFRRYKNGGWPLAFDLILNSIVNNYLGFDLYAQLLLQMNKKIGVKLVKGHTHDICIARDKKSKRDGYPRFEFGKKEAVRSKK